MSTKAGSKPTSPQLFNSSPKSKPSPTKNNANGGLEAVETASVVTTAVSAAQSVATGTNAANITETAAVNYAAVAYAATSAYATASATLIDMPAAVAKAANTDDTLTAVVNANVKATAAETTVTNRTRTARLAAATDSASQAEGISSDDIRSCNDDVVKLNDSPVLDNMTSTPNREISTNRPTDSSRPAMARKSSVDIDGLPLSSEKKKINLRRLLSQSSTEEFDGDNDAILETLQLKDGISNEEQEFPSNDLSQLKNDVEENRLGDGTSVHLSQFKDEEESSINLSQHNKEEGFHLDDYEFPDVDDDPVRRERKLSRKSSIRSTKSDCSQDSITSPACSKKIVKFADAVGMSLEDVRALLDQGEPPLVPTSALKDLNMRRRRTHTEGLFTLMLDFEPPSLRPDFILRLLERKILLENCMVSDSDLSVCCVVRVANVAFSKRVFVRYTLNDWVTEQDVLAVYVPESSDGTSDRFVFSLKLPEGFGLVEARQGRSARMEFALCYCADNLTYWDNNSGDNYLILCRLLAPEIAE